MAKKELMIALVVWISVIVFFTVFFVWGIMVEFIRLLNFTKNIITILPISVAKKLPKAVDYCHMILKSERAFLC
jgi:hypothetical protein